MPGASITRRFPKRKCRFDGRPKVTGAVLRRGGRGRTARLHPPGIDERLQLLVSYAPVALAMFDRDMRYLAVSRRWLEDAGLGNRSVVGLSHYEIFPCIPERWKAAHRRALAGETVRVEEDRCERPEGHSRWQRWEATPWRLPDGSVGGIVLFTEDITERKNALRQQEMQYRAVLETTSDGFWMADTDGRLLAANEAYARRSGYSREELLSMRISDLEAKESPVEVRAHIAALTAIGSDLFETWHRTKSGERWPVEVNTTYWPAAGGHFFVFLRDITERRRAEAELAALHAEMNDLTRRHVAVQTVAALAHELNQPLTALASYAGAALSLIQEGNPRPDRLRHAIESSAGQAQRAGAVIRELLAFLDSGAVKVAPVDLNDLVGKVLCRVARNGFPNVRIDLDLRAGLTPVSANPLQIEKVIAILIENGIEATEGAGLDPVVVSAHTDEVPDGVCVTIADRGPGIDEETRHRVFDPFFTTKPRGLGMGLAISRAIVEAHGGRLWVESDPGAGARFRFTLPIAK